MLSLELGDELHINHQFRWVGIDSDITDDEILYLTSYLSLLFSYHKVFIHLNWSDFSLFKKNYPPEISIYLTTSKFPFDFYNYLKNGIKRFENIDSIQPGFTWWKLDKLKSFIYNSGGGADLDWNLSISNVKNMKQVYLTIIEKNFDKYAYIEKKISDLYNVKENPFIHKYYTFMPFEYLKQKGIIKTIPPSENKNLKTIFSRDDYRIIYKQSIDRVS